MSRYVACMADIPPTMRLIADYRVLEVIITLSCAIGLIFNYIACVMGYELDYALYVTLVAINGGYQCASA